MSDAAEEQKPAPTPLEKLEYVATMRNQWDAACLPYPDDEPYDVSDFDDLDNVPHDANALTYGDLRALLELAKRGAGT